MRDRSDAGSVGIFSRGTNQTQEAWAYSHEGPIRRRKHGYILKRDQSPLSRCLLRLECTTPSSLSSPFAASGTSPSPPRTSRPVGPRTASCAAGRGPSRSTIEIQRTLRISFAKTGPTNSQYSIDQT
eukprot:763727-Prorocentrum_minimum.AAC.6